MLCGEHCPFFACRKNAGVVVSRKLPRGGLRQFNQLNDLRKSGTKILPTLSLCFLARVSHRKTIRLRNERSPVTPSARRCSSVLRTCSCLFEHFGTRPKESDTHRAYVGSGTVSQEH